MRYLVLLLVLFSTLTLAAQDILTFRDTTQEQQYLRLTQELRCPKCQNSSIADSGSVIAADMRQKVYQLLREGKSEQQIIDFMVARYGYFISYEPPLTPLTWLLWGAPLAVIMLGGVVIYRRTRQPVSLASDDRHPVRYNAVVPSWQWGSCIVLVVGIVALLIVRTGDIGQVLAWRQAVVQSGMLLQQYQDDPQSMRDKTVLARLALGLRTRLVTTPEDVSGWMQLGCISLQQNNAAQSIQAFNRAHAIAPENTQVTLGLAEVLTRSASPADNQRGGELLKSLILGGNTTLPVLNLLAVNAQQQQHYTEALIAWKMVLKLLPADDPHRAQILDDIERLRQKRP